MEANTINMLVSLIEIFVLISAGYCTGLSGKYVVIQLKGAQELLNADNNVTQTDRNIILSILEDIKRQLNYGNDVEATGKTTDSKLQIFPTRIPNQAHNTDLTISLIQKAFQEEKARSRRDHRFIDHRLATLEAKSGERMTMLAPKNMCCSECKRLQDTLREMSVGDILQGNVQNQTHELVLQLSSVVKNISNPNANILNNTETTKNVGESGKVEIESVNTAVNKYTSCGDINDSKSGVYTIYPDFQPSGLQVFCDLDTDGGGWMVFQRRKDGFIDFYRGWNDYKTGFGDLNWEFWLGNDNLHLFTSARPTELRIDLTDINGQKGHGKYSLFKVDSGANQYKLFSNGFDGNIKDGLARQNNMMFSTKDRDNDARSDSCAIKYHGAWWYKDCFNSNLNADYFGTGSKAVTWHVWHGGTYIPLQFTEMKLRWKY